MVGCKKRIAETGHEVGPLPTRRRRRLPRTTRPTAMRSVRPDVRSAIEFGKAIKN